MSTSTTIAISINNSGRKYTYQCALPVTIGDDVNVKLPSGHIVSVEVLEVHDTPQLSDKWETKWAVVTKTKAEKDAEKLAPSSLGESLGLRND